MTIHNSGPEPMKIRKTTLAQQMAKQKPKPLLASKRKKPYPGPSGDTGGYSPKRSDSGQLPPHQPWGPQDRAHPTAPDCNQLVKIYPLGPQRTGGPHLTWRQLGKGPTSSHLHLALRIPTFTVKRRDGGTLQIIHEIPSAQ